MTQYIFNNFVVVVGMCHICRRKHKHQYMTLKALIGENSCHRCDPGIIKQNQIRV